MPAAIVSRRRAMLGLGVAVAGFGLRAGEAGASPRIGAVLYARDSQYWQQIERGMKDAAAKYGATLQVELSRRQLPTESQVIDDLMTRGIDALVISPLDKTASAAAIKRATAAGALSVEFNTFLADKSISRYYVGVDNTELAAVVGRAVRVYAGKMPGADKLIGIITLPPMNPGSAIRKAGFLSALQGLTYTVAGEAAAATPEDGANAFETILQRNPATQIVWCSSAGSIEGAAASARRAGTKVRLFGIDMSKSLADNMLDPAGNIEAVSDQQPYRIGYLAVETAVKARDGAQMARDVVVPAKLYERQTPQAIHEYLDLLKSLAG